PSPLPLTTRWKPIGCVPCFTEPSMWTLPTLISVFSALASHWSALLSGLIVVVVALGAVVVVDRCDVAAAATAVLRLAAAGIAASPAATAGRRTPARRGR